MASKSYENLLNETIGVDFREEVLNENSAEKAYQTAIEHMLKYENAADDYQSSGWIDTILRNYEEMHEELNKLSEKQRVIRKKEIEKKVASRYKRISERAADADHVNASMVPKTMPDDYTLDNFLNGKFLHDKFMNSYNADSYFAVKKAMNSAKYKNVTGTTFDEDPRRK